MQNQQPSIEELFDQGIVPEFDRELTQEEKTFVIKGALEAVHKPLMYTFYLTGLQTHITSTVTNGENGDVFELSFKRIVKGDQSPQSDS
jgi:hypothetical protein